VAKSSEAPAGISVVYHGTDDLRTEQDSTPDGEATFPVEERTQYSQSLGSVLPNLIDVIRSGQPFTKGHPQITGCVDPYNCLPQSSTGRDFWVLPLFLAQSMAVLFETLMAILGCLSHRSR
jgi:hypothetical protein